MIMETLLFELMQVAIGNKEKLSTTIPDKSVSTQ